MAIKSTKSLLDIYLFRFGKTVFGRVSRQAASITCASDPKESVFTEEKVLFEKYGFRVVSDHHPKISGCGGVTLKVRGYGKNHDKDEFFYEFENSDHAVEFCKNCIQAVKHINGKAYTACYPEGQKINLFVDIYRYL